MNMSEDQGKIKIWSQNVIHPEGNYYARSYKTWYIEVIFHNVEKVILLLWKINYVKVTKTVKVAIVDILLSQQGENKVTMLLLSPLRSFIVSLGSQLML